MPIKVNSSLTLALPKAFGGVPPSVPLEKEMCPTRCCCAGAGASGGAGVGALTG